MTVEKVSYAGHPERIVEEAHDCVWVRFLPRKKPSPITNLLLQWLDWKMQGRLSRYLQTDNATKAQTTFLPTMKRIASPLIALEPPGEIDWKSFAENCSGLGIGKLLVLCEDVEDLASLEKELRGQKAAGLERVVLGVDTPAGRA